ncbi:class I SAM-dependent rRNA methyltransferase [Thermoflexus sp.]|uniref:class I SAM-dependent rRNA methyltransferase n=1 Tax=Thermoflexus sp. TaxID=1969742 RepID=UPI0035E466BA
MKPSVILKPNAGRKLRNFYPWAFHDDIADIQGDPEPGAIVLVRDSSGAMIGQAFYNPGASIPIRMLTRGEERLDAGWFRRRLMEAAARRREIRETNAVRLVHGEADNLPGLIVDRYGEVLVVQIRNMGMERWRESIVEALRELFAPRGIYERSDVEAREDEGLEPRTGLLWGEAPDPVEVLEDGLVFETSVVRGQKTGFYLDQRDNRRRLRGWVRPGDQVLDVYGYIGPFALHAAAAGATAVVIDKDPWALGQVERNALRNGLADRVTVRLGDALEMMGALLAEGRRFDWVVLDPPAMVKRRVEWERGVRRRFVEMARLALGLLKDGGGLFFSSCAYWIRLEDLMEAVRLAASDVGCRLRVRDVTYQPLDHPWILQIPETLYLKTLIVEKQSANGSDFVRPRKADLPWG